MKHGLVHHQPPIEITAKSMYCTCMFPLVLHGAWQTARVNKLEVKQTKSSATFTFTLRSNQIAIGLLFVLLVAFDIP